MKILILSVLAVAMIGLIVPSVYGQVQVTATPFVDSWKKGEINYVDITVNRVVPNTNFCFEYIFEDGEVITVERRAYGSDNMFDYPIFKHASGLEERYGEIDITIFYGDCDDENFGSTTITVNYVNEWNPTTEFMMKNYSLESIDVGISWDIHGPDGENMFSCTGITSFKNAPCDAEIGQSLKADKSFQTYEVVIMFSENGFSDEFIEGKTRVKASDKISDKPVENYRGFECKRFFTDYKTWEHCSNKNFIIKSYEREDDYVVNLHSDSFVKSIIDKIHSNPIPINSKIEEKQSLEVYSYESTHVSNFPDPSKSPQHYLDRYNTENTYRDWFDSQFPDRTIHDVLGLPEPTVQKIPDWVKNIFTWYSQDQISEDEVLNAIKFLVNQGIIDLDE